MTNEEIMKATAEQIEARIAEIRAAVQGNTEGADFEAMSAELDQLTTRRDQIAEEQRKADLAAVIDGAGTETPITTEKEKNNMKEFRNSPEYINAFAEYVKSGDDREVRALLTTNAPEDGTIVVPTIVEDKIRTAWEKSDLFSRIGKSEVKGNLAIGFEISGTDAVIHEEGTEAPDEEELVLGTVTLVPKNIKKWISVSDEVMDLRGEAFLNYIYDELAYKVVKKAENVAVAAVIACVGASTATKAGQATVAAEPGRAGVVEAIATISDEAQDLCIVMNRSTWGAYEATRTLNTGDPFADLPVVYNNSLKAYSVADEDDPLAIVGDFGFGMRANLPNGFNVKTIVDDKSRAKEDMVDVTAKLFAGIDCVAQNAFCVITKPAAEAEAEG